MPALGQIVRYCLDEADIAVMAVREIPIPIGTTCAAIVDDVAGAAADLQVLINRDTPMYYTRARTEGSEGQPGSWVPTPGA